MRIVAGEFSSRKIETKKGDSTRPTLDKVREAVFSSLGGYFDGGIMLDLYAGSGAVGLEALSRGMDFAYFCDKDREAVQVIRSNISSLKVEDRTKVFPIAGERALLQLKEKKTMFDLVYLDPPYKLQKNEEQMQFLVQNGMLKEHARVVVESLKEETYPDAVGTLVKYKEAVYGITKITYYRMQDAL